MSDLFSKVGIDLGVVVLLLIVLIIVMMIMTVSMSLRLSRLNQKYRSFMKGKDAQSLEKLFHQRFKEIDKLNKQNELTKKNLADLKKIQGMTLGVWIREILYVQKTKHLSVDAGEYKEGSRVFTMRRKGGN